MANKVEQFNSDLTEIPTSTSSNQSSIGKTMGIAKMPYKGPIKKSVTIKEADNGYIVDIYAADFDATLVYPDLKKMLSAITGFLRTEVTEE